MKANYFISSVLAITMAGITFSCEKSRELTDSSAAVTSASVNEISAVVAACSAQGWASQNGGTTGGGTAAATVVTTYATLKAAILIPV